ncbi:MltA-interacting protein precursor [Sesbania bispinosa]|nr:MltA-interacting protein precursor [Sesbania bispinosa]
MAALRGDCEGEAVTVSKELLPLCASLHIFHALLLLEASSDNTTRFETEWS